MNEEIIKKINEHLYHTIETWLPTVRRSSQGFQACNPIRGDNNPSSMTIYPDGRAYDFASKDSLDCIKLWAAQNNLDNKTAIKHHIEQLGLSNGKIQGGISGKRPKLTVIKNTFKKEAQFIYPPEAYPQAAFTHYQYGAPSVVYPYFDIEGKLIGYTCRFDLKNRSKVVLPFTYSDIIGKNKDGSLKKSNKPSWHWNAYGWQNNWPIYGLEKLNQNPHATILIVEGEKTSDAAQRLLPDCVVLSWAGGTSKADKVNWKILKGRTIFIWPDEDLKRHKYTDELIQKNEQPGMKAAIQIAQELEDEKPKIVIPPAGVEDGWDLADAEKEDWTGSKVYEYLTRSAFTEEDLEKELGITWIPKHKTNIKSDNYHLNLSKYAIPDDLESRFSPLVATEQRINSKGEIKYEINVPKTIENYMKEFISDKFIDTNEFVILSEKEKENRKKAIIAKKSFQAKTHKSLLTQIWCDCDKTVKKNVSREAIENHFANILEQKREQAFSTLQEKTGWDGTAFEDALRITTIWLSHALTSTNYIIEDNIKEFEPQARAILHFIWQVKRKLNGFQAEMHMAPILLGDQGNGKSEIIRNIAKVLAIPFGNFVRDAYVDEIGEEKNEAILANSLINILDEMAGAARAEMNKVKNFITRHKVNPREFHSQRTMGEMINLSTFICAANANNLSEILHDESGNRRFFPIKVYGFINKKYAFDGISSALLNEKFKWIEETGECFPYSFDALALWKIVNHMWPCFIRTEEVSKIQADHRYEPVKQWLENFNAEIIDEEEYKRLQMKNEILGSDIELVSTGFLRELFLSMLKMNPAEVKKWSIQKFSLELQKVGINTWKNNSRGKYHKYMVCALKADWSQIDQKFKDRLTP